MMSYSGSPGSWADDAAMRIVVISFLLRSRATTANSGIILFILTTKQYLNRTAIRSALLVGDIML